MIEGRDGSFGEIKPSQEIVDQLSKLEAGINDKVRAAHFGTIEELEKRRQEEARTVYKGEIEHINLKLMDIEKKLNRIMIHLGIDDKSEILIT